MKNTKGESTTLIMSSKSELLEALIDIQQAMSDYITIANLVGISNGEDGAYLGHAMKVEENARLVIVKALGK